MNLFSDDYRRDPYPVYRQLRAQSPLQRIPPPFDAWMLLDFDSVKRVLNDHEAFSSRVPAPPWFIFSDPPVHTRLRALISHSFTPRMIAGLEPRIRGISRSLISGFAARNEIDLAADYAVPLAMRVIAGMLGIPPEDWQRFRHWSDVILTISHSRSGGEQAERSLRDFAAVAGEMNAYLAEVIASRREQPQDDLLTSLMNAEVDGQRLLHQEILSFFQLLLVAGQETTANLIDNFMLCMMEHPGELARLRAAPDLLPSAIEETLRYRAPFQWLMRTPRYDLELHGQKMAPGKLLLCMIGAANRDAAKFPDPDRFDIGRDPNPHIAFGHGIHFCLGAALARLEARIALGDLLAEFGHFELVGGKAWEPRAALNVLGPASLPIRIERGHAASLA